MEATGNPNPGSGPGCAPLLLTWDGPIRSHSERSAESQPAGLEKYLGPFDPALLDAPPEGVADRAPLADGPLE